LPNCRLGSGFLSDDPLKSKDTPDYVIAPGSTVSREIQAEDPGLYDFIVACSKDPGLTGWTQKEQVRSDVEVWVTK